MIVSHFLCLMSSIFSMQKAKVYPKTAKIFETLSLFIYLFAIVEICILDFDSGTDSLIERYANQPEQLQELLGSLCLGIDSDVIYIFYQREMEGYTFLVSSFAATGYLMVRYKPETALLNDESIPEAKKKVEIFDRKV